MIKTLITNEIKGSKKNANKKAKPDKFINIEKDKKLFDKNPDKSKQWIDMTDEHFLVWMRPSGLPNPKKLWGRINRDLKKGEIIDVIFIFTFF